MTSKNFAWTPSQRGDIRASSMGDDYPWTVEPCLPSGGYGPTCWRAANLISGWVGKPHRTYQGAEREMTVERLYSVRRWIQQTGGSQHA